MMDRDDYRASWEWKKHWYEENGFVLGRNLFATRDDERGGLDSTEVGKVAKQIQPLL